MEDFLTKGEHLLALRQVTTMPIKRYKWSDRSELVSLRTYELEELLKGVRTYYMDTKKSLRIKSQGSELVGAERFELPTLSV